MIPLLAMLLAGPSVIGPQPDVSGLARQADLASAAATANAAKTAADSARASIPPICSAPPSGDTLNGSIGSTAPCTSRPDDTRPTAVQAANTTLAADCTWSVTFKRAFTSATPVVHAEAVLPAGGTQPISCSPISRSMQVESGRCFAGQILSLTLAGITAGLSANANGGACVAGIPIMVWGREPTQ